MVVVVWVGAGAGAGLGAAGAGIGLGTVGAGAAAAGADCCAAKSARHWLRNFGQVIPAGTWLAALAACHLSPHCFITDWALAAVARQPAAANAITQTAARIYVFTIRHHLSVAGAPARRVPRGQADPGRNLGESAASVNFKPAIALLILLVMPRAAGSSAGFAPEQALEAFDAGRQAVAALFHFDHFMAGDPVHLDRSTRPGKWLMAMPRVVGAPKNQKRPTDRRHFGNIIFQVAAVAQKP
jgi:hypothetical protein